MSGQVEARLAQHGIRLPEAPPVGGVYVPVRRNGNLLHVAGQVSANEERKVVGRLGDDLDVAAGREAAEICAINILSQLRAFCARELDGGDLDRITGCFELRGFVNATPDFDDHPGVINGASELIVSALGENGRHARAAVGVASLPFGFAVEVAGLFGFAA